MRRFIVLLFLLAISVPFVTAQDDAVGTLEFRANGEDFVRQGFESKDGWNISFNHIYVAVSQIRAHQTNPPYDPFAGELTSSATMVGLAGQMIIDLAEGDADADTILVGTVENAPEGFYNAVAWVVSPAEEGDIEGYSLVIDGIAEKDGETVEFVISIDEDYTYTCGAFIGDERKGVLPAGETGDVEMTFHFDHIFGDAETALDDSLNELAPGFNVFATLATDGMLDVSLSDLEMSLSPEDYQMLFDILPTLGHTGEGHCHES
ncbi:MAG: DUF4382 domain-containing protein [Phototrophicaceae bacterium]